MRYYDAILNALGTEIVTEEEFSGAEILAKLIGVDGSGSGLDADLLDGNHASAFVLTNDARLSDARTPTAHDHSGNKLAQANTHESADTDSGTTALHHTLGTGAHQACAGNDSRLNGDTGANILAKLALEPGSASRVQVDNFAQTGNWSKQSWAKLVLVQIIGAGGGAGSGRVGAASTLRTGGGAGGGGAYATNFFDAGTLESVVLVTIGAGGSGGPAISQNDTHGQAGTSGGQTSFGSYLTANGGFGGDRGSNSAASGGSSRSGDGQGGSGGSCSNGLATTPAAAGRAGSGGGGGGGITLSGIDYAGANGAPNATVSGVVRDGGTGGGKGLSGAAPTDNDLAFVVSGGAGGGGGGSGIATGGNAGNGGNGGLPGGGGGGGGAALNGSVSGAGGNGGAGYARVIQIG